MGRATVRAAVTASLTNAAAAGTNSPTPVPYLGTVYPARPVIINDQDYYQSAMLGEASAIIPSENGSAAVAVINIPTDGRFRKSDSGRGHVDDAWIHDIVLELFFASSGPGMPGLGSPQGVGAQQDYDAIVDAITIWVRANATMGQPTTVVWSAGEYAAGVKHTQSAAFTADESDTIFILGALRFEAWEWISGQNI